MWSMPGDGDEPYEQAGTAIRHQQSVLVGHTDVVWDLHLHPLRPFVVSASADGSIKVWRTDAASPLLRSIHFRAVDGVMAHVPTSICVPSAAPSNHIIAAYTSGAVVSFDIETGQPVLCVDAIGGAVDGLAVGLLPPDETRQPNRIIAHPSLSLLVCAHEDGNLRFIDRVSGKINMWIDL